MCNHLFDSRYSLGNNSQATEQYSRPSWAHMFNSFLGNVQWVVRIGKYAHESPNQMCAEELQFKHLRMEEVALKAVFAPL